MGCAQSDIPPAVGYGNATQAVLNAELTEAPQMMQAEMQYQPQLSQLASNDTLSAMDNMLYGSNGNQGTIANTTAATTAARAGNVSNLQSMGPQAMAAILAANPQQAQLLQQLNTTASAGLSAGSSLTPAQQQAMQQQARAAYAARGTTGDPESMAAEIMNQFNLGQNLLQQREGFAGSVAGMNQNDLTDPMLAILGNGSSNALGYAGGSNSGAGFDLFNPNAGIGMIQGNNNLLATEKAANPTALSGVMQIAGSIGGMVGGASSAATG